METRWNSPHRGTELCRRRSPVMRTHTGSTQDLAGLRQNLPHTIPRQSPPGTLNRAVTVSLRKTLEQRLKQLVINAEGREPGLGARNTRHRDKQKERLISPRGTALARNANRGQQL